MCIMRMICSTKNSVLSAEPKQGVVHYTKVSVGSRLGARDRFATRMDYDQSLTPFRALVYG